MLTLKGIDMPKIISSTSKYFADCRVITFIYRHERNHSHSLPVLAGTFPHLIILLDRKYKEKKKQISSLYPYQFMLSRQYIQIKEYSDRERVMVN